MKKLPLLSLLLFLILSCSKIVPIIPISKFSHNSENTSSEEEMAIALSNSMMEKLFGKSTKTVTIIPSDISSVKQVCVPATKGIGSSLAYAINYSDNRGFCVVRFIGGQPFVVAISDNGNIDTDSIFNEIQDDEHSALYSVLAGSLTDDMLNEPIDTCHAHLYVDYLSHDPDSLHVTTGEWMADNDIKPLVPFKWGQAYPYNQHMPLISQEHEPYYSYDRYRGRYAVGCVPLAATMIMATMQQPSSFLGHIGVYYWYEFDTIGKYYNYSDFLYYTFDDYADDYTWIKTDKLADMLACVSGQYQTRTFQTNGTFCVVAETVDVLDYYASYCYNDGECRGVLDQDTLDAGILASLSVGMPLMVFGNAHAWVLDGILQAHRHALNSIENLTLYHFNWGWNGFGDGYYFYGDFALSNRVEQDPIDTNHGVSYSTDNYFQNNSFVIFFTPYHG